MLYFIIYRVFLPKCVEKGEFAMHLKKIAALLLAMLILVTGCSKPVSEEVPPEETSSASESSEAESSKPETSSSESSSESSSAETSSEEETSSEAEASSESSSESSSAPESKPESKPEETSKPESKPEEKPDETPAQVEGYVDSVSVDVEGVKQESVLVSEAQSAAIPDVLEPSASGTLREENTKAIIDYSNTRDGYVMVKFTADTQKKLKTQVKGPSTTYTYNIYKGQWAVLPITDGNGTYQIKVYENVTGNEYSLVLAVEQKITLKDEFAPFLRPNQYVNYSEGSKTVKKAANLCSGISNPLEKVQAVYNYVVKNISYDTNKAATVKSGYLPVLDTVLSESKGICFDYAALMTGMLRSQGVPCKMVFGYAGTAYHAWISVWTEDEGWVDGAIFFDGTSWHRLDPTFASSGGQSAEIMQYIGNGSNYTSKYFY